MNMKAASTWFVVVVLTAAPGAHCNRRDPATYAAFGPRVLTQNPSLGDIMQVVNDNSAKIRSLYTTDATLTVPGAPSLRTNLVLERTKRLRLRAETAITGAELDMGSNDELFWVWIRRNPPPTVYYCRHEDFATSAAKQYIPIEPQWLFDAVGLVSFDGSLQHSPPTRNANGRLEIRTIIPSGTGNKSRMTVVDEARGWVMEQHLYDEAGTLVASALTNRHWRDPGTGAIVPQEIEIRSPATQFTMKLDIRQWTVNSIPADPAQLFAMPSVPGWNTVNLADPNMQASPPVTQSVPAAMSPSPNASSATAVPPANAGATYSTGGAVQAPNYGVSGGAASPMGPMFQAPPGAPVGYGAPQTQGMQPMQAAGAVPNGGLPARRY